MTSSLAWDDKKASQRASNYSKADWDSLRTFYSAYNWSSGFQRIIPLLPLSSTKQYHGICLFTPSSYKPGKKDSPKWFNSQCRQAVSNKSHYFKARKRLQELLSSTNATFAQKPYKISNKLLSNASTAKSLPARLAFAPLVYGHSCLSELFPLTFPSTKKQL